VCLSEGVCEGGGVRPPPREPVSRAVAEGRRAECVCEAESELKSVHIYAYTYIHIYIYKHIQINKYIHILNSHRPRLSMQRPDVTTTPRWARIYIHIYYIYIFVHT